MSILEAPRSTVEIPQPPVRMLLGNVADLRRRATRIESLVDLTREYGGICQLQVPSGRLVVVGDPDLAMELCDEERFEKNLGPGLRAVRGFLADGLFTARSDEPNWALAHRILMPTFSQASIKAYMPDMVEIAMQLVATLDRHCSEGTAFHVTTEMTKLTLDTIALCGFSYRFDSFQRPDQHPFVDAMMTVLTSQQANTGRLAALSRFLHGNGHHNEEATQIMEQTVADIVRQRRAAGPLKGRQDLLEFMLTGVDKMTGERLPDENIKVQCVTFLIAGHETTSGLLSFALYYLMKNPAFAAKVQAEVDTVLGRDLSQAPTYDQVHQLHYTQQVLEETLRLWPTAPAFTRSPRRAEGEILGGKYFIPQDQGVTLVLPAIHRDKRYWGEDAEEFEPAHFSPEAVAARTKQPYFPFGTGARACIGRQFALQEAKLVLGLIMQRFDLVDSELYRLHIKQSLTIKPEGFQLKLRRRPSANTLAPTAPGVERPAEVADGPALLPGGEGVRRLGVTIQILFGSNLGACEAMAHDLADHAGRVGFDVSTSCLDDAVEKLGQGPVVIICSSYNGTPPENAKRFISWLDQVPSLPDGAGFAVFGCGNREWHDTYQKVPRHIDTVLAGKGAKRLFPLSEGDVSEDLDAAFRSWKHRLWVTLSGQFGISVQAAASQIPLYNVEVVEDLHPNPFAEVYRAAPMVVIDNRELQDCAQSGRSTRHLELTLPVGATYQPGDHLGVIPQNHGTLVARVAAAFGLTAEVRVRLHKGREAVTGLPTERIISVGTLLTHYVELQEPATRHQVQILAGYATAPAEKEALQALAGEESYASARAQRKSIVDLLEEFPSVAIPFGHYLELVPPLKPRYYSISSSPKAGGRIASITVGVVDALARNGRGRYQGVCSNYLAGISRGQSIYAFLHDAHAKFHLPISPSVPMVMVGAGTGVAPFRGFLQERAEQKREGKQVARSLLFFGCRHPLHDHIYAAELREWENQGLVQVVTAFSRESESKVYVQDRLREHGAAVWHALQEGGSFYVCGDASGMAKGVRSALAEIVATHGAMPAEQADAFLLQLIAGERYMLDVWAS